MCFFERVKLLTLLVFVYLVATTIEASATPPPGSFKVKSENNFITTSNSKAYACAFRKNKWIPGNLIGRAKDRFYPSSAKIKNLKAKLERATTDQVRAKLQTKIKKLRDLKKQLAPLCAKGPILKRLPDLVTAEHIHQLYRRAGLGVPPAQAYSFVGKSIDTLVDYFMEPIDEPELEAEAETWLDENPQEPNFPDPNAWITPNGLQLYALHILLNSANQFHTRLALLELHDRLATSSAALAEGQVGLMHQHLQLLLNKGSRDMDYAGLIELLGKDPTMIKWLSLDLNIASGPNENYARELMELFSLDTQDSSGLDNYSDLDIAQIARAFTGWSVQQNPQGQWISNFTPANFDSNSKIIFAGTAYQGLVKNGDDVVRHIFANHPNAGESLAKWILREYLRPDYAVEMTSQLAEILKENNFNMREAFKRLLESEEFYKAENQYTIAKRPVERAIHLLRLMRSVGMPFETGNNLRFYIASTGCVVTRPESVFGCDLEDINNGALLINSANFITRLSNNDSVFSQNLFNYSHLFPNSTPSVEQMIEHFEQLFAVKLNDSQKFAVLQYLSCSYVTTLSAIRCNSTNGDNWNPANADMVRTRIAGLFRIFSLLPQVHDLR